VPHLRSLATLGWNRRASSKVRTVARWQCHIAREKQRDRAKPPLLGSADAVEEQDMKVHRTHVIGATVGMVALVAFTHTAKTSPGTWLHPDDAGRR